MPRRPTGRTTSHDVARRAGVSQSTVSIALSGNWLNRVSPATVQRIEQAARELDYRPNLAARSLRSTRTRTVLLLVPALTNAYFAQVHAGAGRVAAERQIGVPVVPLSAEDESTPLPLAAQA